MQKVFIFGLGHFAGDIINRMIDRRKNLNFAIADENKEVLNSCKAPLKIFPHEIHDFKKFFAENFHDTAMIFIIDIFGEFKDFALKLAYAAKSSGALTIGIPIQNKEFDEKDFQRFKDYSDSVILSCVNENEFLDVPVMIIEGITTLITEHGKVNVDFLDIKSVLYNAGTVFFGTGYAEGKNKSKIAAQKAATMCGNEKIAGAKNILLNLTTDCDTPLSEMSDAAGFIEKFTAHDTQVIWGHVIDDNMLDSIRVTLITSMHDNGYVSYYDMFMHESCENLSSLVKNGITPVMKLRLGSEKSFFTNGLIYGSLEIIRLFIACGYDPKTLEDGGIFPNKILEGIISRDDAVKILNILFVSGITLNDNFPILFAKTPEVYKVFANYGWNVNSHTNDKMTVLAHAVRKHSAEHVKTLIELGADVDSRDDEGRTPLMRLISNLQYRWFSPDSLQKLKLLLDSGADIFAVDNEGENALGEYVKYRSIS